MKCQKWRLPADMHIFFLLLPFVPWLVLLYQAYHLCLPPRNASWDFTLVKTHRSRSRSLSEHVVLCILRAHLHCCAEQNGQFSFCKAAIQIPNRADYFFPELQLLNALSFAGVLLCWIRNSHAGALKVEPCVLLTLWKTMPSVTWFRSVV